MDGLTGRLKMRHIVCFLETARRGSVVRAAGALNLTQPGVSRTIKELETILGAALFARGGRTLRLSATGRLFMSYAERAMTALAEGVEATGSRADGAPVRIGALPTAASQILPPAITALHRLGSAPRVRIVTAPHAQLLLYLRRGEIDFVLGRMAEPQDIAGLSFEYLYEERLSVVVRPGHPLLAAGASSLREAGGYTWLVPPPDAAIRQAVERFVASLGMEIPSSAIETVSDTFARSFLRETDALWLISHGVAARDIGDGVLASLPLPLEHTSGPVGLTLRAGAPPSPAAQVLIDTVKRVCADHRPSSR